MIEKNTGFGVKWKWERASNFKQSFLNRISAWSKIDHKVNELAPLWTEKDESIRQKLQNKIRIYLYIKVRCITIKHKIVAEIEEQQSKQAPHSSACLWMTMGRNLHSYFGDTLAAEKLIKIATQYFFLVIEYTIKG